MSHKKFFVVIIILLVGAGITALASKSERVKPNKSFDQFPLKIDNWQGRKSKLDEQVYNILGVEDYILANYVNPSGEYVNLYVGFYQSQKEGDIIHSPKNCMPGSGWKIIDTSIEQVDLSGNGSQTKVIRLLLQKGVEKQVVLYWFQSRGRIIASEYMQKVWLIVDSVLKQRTDGSFVRLISPVDTDEKKTLEVLKNFAKSVYPYLNEHIPS